MKNTFFILALSLFVVACGNKDNAGENSTEESAYVDLKKLDVDALDAEIKKRSKAVEMDTLGSKDLAVALLEAYEVYGEKFPNYTNAAEYTFRAGEIAMNLNHTAQSIKLFTKVYDEYKDYEKRPYALFMKAFVLENQAMNFPEAEIHYKKFVKDYPDHPMADDAEYSLKNLGKTPEELIREFERQDSIRKAEEAA